MNRRNLCVAVRKISLEALALACQVKYCRFRPDYCALQPSDTQLLRRETRLWILSPAKPSVCCVVHLPPAGATTANGPTKSSPASVVPNHPTIATRQQRVVGSSESVHRPIYRSARRYASATHHTIPPTQSIDNKRSLRPCSRPPARRRIPSPATRRPARCTCTWRLPSRAIGGTVSPEQTPRWT